MNNDKLQIYEYNYLDEKSAEIREEVLKKFISNNADNKDMEFFDLSIYLKRDSLKNRINSLINRSMFDDNIVLSESQIEILDILEEKNLFLSAPTSFGKTFIVLEYIMRHPELKNIVFIVPTLALMNELLKKLYIKFGNNYNICINANEKIEERNIYIFVPERSDCSFVKRISEVGLDLLIIDEIYKLKPQDKKELKNDDRIIVMNKVYLNLIDIARKIILLGPFIKQIEFKNTKLDIVKYYTNLSPVYNEVINCCDKEWINYIDGTKELVYFYTPDSINKSAEIIINKLPEQQDYIEKYKNEILHLENIFFKEWYGIKLLKRGIGVHHGKIPMFLRKFYEDEYRNGSLKCLLCTSTLMEGVNTPTMKMLVVDDPGSIFKLNNLIGRVGRLNTRNPAYGKVLIFNTNTYEKYADRNKWDKLVILSEDPKVSSDDELLFLKKKTSNSEEEYEYNEKIKAVTKESEKTIDIIREYDIRIDIANKFVKENYKEKFLNAPNIGMCIKLSCELLLKISYKFNKNQFNDINYPNGTLPYLVFTNQILSNKTFGKIISSFENKYGSLSEKNINLLIDKLLELRTTIKFKLSKILNYFELFNIEYSKSSVLNEFVSKLKRFNELSTINKIFEDLGIEQEDFKKLENFFDTKEKTSASLIIQTLHKNKDKINNLELSPFTKRNISKF